MRKARGDYERLEVELRALSPSGSGDQRGAPCGRRSRTATTGRSSSACAALRDRSRIVSVATRTSSSRSARPSGGPDDRRPRWVDLGCGQGEFCALLGEWGWDVEGVDASPDAVEACRARGIDVTLADVLAYLETRPDDPVGGVSAIQLIEHLPRRAWVHLFEEIHRALAPGGALLLETINGQNPDAIADYFVADVTHTWPGHPETLRLMAEHAGFERGRGAVPPRGPSRASARRGDLGGQGGLVTRTEGEEGGRGPDGRRAGRRSRAGRTT